MSIVDLAEWKMYLANRVLEVTASERIKICDAVDIVCYGKSQDVKDLILKECEKVMISWHGGI